MLGSSSTTRIFSLSAIFLPREPRSSSDRFGDYSTLIGKRKEKELPLPTFAIHPNFSAMRLDQALGDRQSQAHSR